MIDWPAPEYTILSQGSVREETDWRNAHLNRWTRIIGEFGSRCNRRTKPALVSAARDRRTTEAAARTVQSPQQLIALLQEPEFPREGFAFVALFLSLVRSTYFVCSCLGI